ncbi:MAG TPA: hypothetical protein VIJ25_19010 [Methylococcales bacterium]
MAQSQRWQWIPTHLTLEQFEEFVLPHLHIGSRGPQPKLSLHAIFNYQLVVNYILKLVSVYFNFENGRTLITTGCGFCPLGEFVWKPLDAWNSFDSN